MATASVLGTGTTAGTTLNVAWRKSQSMLLKGYNTRCKEWGWLNRLRRFKIAESAREMTCPIDVKRANHSSSIPEGGYEMRPSTPNLAETTVTWSNYNHRFSVTLTAKFLSRLGKDNKIVDQFKYQSMKAIEGLSDTVSRDFYGFSTGVWCKISTASTQSSGTALTMIDGYGLTQTHFDQASFLGAMFALNDYVALVRSGSLVANGIGVITAIDTATPTFTATWNGTVTTVSGDSVVLAQSIENTTLAGTNYNKALVGLAEVLTSVAVHGLTNTAEANWAVALGDTNGGRFSGVKFRKMKQAVEDQGGVEMDRMIWARGVDNDTFASQSGAVRFANPNAMELDGEVTGKGVEFLSSKYSLPGYAIGYNSDSYQRINLVDIPGEDLGQVWEDGDKMEGQNAFAFSADLPLGLVCTRRRGFAYYGNLTES